jgi:ketosteroid isomerase-like protein
MHFKVSLAALIVAVSASPTSAQAADSPKNEVIAAVQAWLDAFEANDAAKLASLTHKDGVQFSARYLPGQERIRVRSNRQDLEEAATPQPRYTERFWSPTVLVRADLAQFWAPYSFDIDGKRSHCGIDNFTLMRIDGRWVMTNASWTVEPPETSCAALGEPKR